MVEPRAVADGGRTLVRYSPLKIGGVLYLIAVFQFFVFELVAETLYPGYSVARNYISDLGGACVNPPSILHCVVHQPTATIFDTTVVLLGLMLLAGTLFVYLGTRKKLYFVTSAVADICILLVGVFPEPTGWPHAILSVILFYSLGISLILAWPIAKGNVIRYVTLAAGILTLFFNVDNAAAGTIGVGGQERLLVLSALLGLVALGGYLIGQDSQRPPVESRRAMSVKPWTLAAIVATATAIGLFAITVAIAFVLPRTHLAIPGILAVLPNLVLLLSVVSVILWIVTAARWLAHRRGLAHSRD
ncbi:MAG: DUF998 domain-containing protein [Actinobacteria bacterium]|nr:DUF998 domain-containing protein [Actinomycetota bacterium]